MRYLLASDLHYGLQQLDWIAEQAGEFDAVVLGGDHLDVAGHVDLNTQIVLLTAYFAGLADSTTVIANSGNHDLSSRGAHGEKFAAWLADVDSRVATDGSTITLGPDLVSVCAWWEGPVTRTMLEHQLAVDAQRRPADASWIWVYHSPPDASPTSISGGGSRRRHFGDDVLNALIAEHSPDLVLAGHVHESPFHPEGSWHDRLGSTVVLNAGRQRGPIPAHIILDTAAKTLGWWSVEATETIQF